MKTFLSYQIIAEQQWLPISGGTREIYNHPLTLQELKNVLSAGKNIMRPSHVRYSMPAHLSEAVVEAILKNV